MQKIRKNNYMRKKSQLKLVGFLFILISICLFSMKYLNLIINQRKEQEQLKTFYTIDLSNVILEEPINPSAGESVIQENEIKENYIAVIRIPKIKLEKGLYKKESYNNNLNKTIQILQESDYPNEINGNFILVGHSGTGRIAYFNWLNKLQKEDLVYVDYNHISYTYKVAYIYEVLKTGKINIKRNVDTKTLTMITCKSGTDKQIVIISEIVGEESY